jgi:hypothetical protein
MHVTNNFASEKTISHVCNSHIDILNVTASGSVTNSVIEFYKEACSSGKDQTGKSIEELEKNDV